MILLFVLTMLLVTVITCLYMGDDRYDVYQTKQEKPSGRKKTKK